MADSLALMVKSAGTLPFHIEQRFAAASGAGTLDCGSGLALPDSLAAEGVLTPHLGHTKSLMVGMRCSANGEIVSLEGLARHVGATGDTVYAIWTGEINRTTKALTLQFLLVGGTGRFDQTTGSATATGEVDLAQRTGWYRGEGTIGPRDTTPPPGAVQLVPETIAAGGSHSCGLTLDGKAYCWGFNTGGALGDGTTNNSTTPVPVLGGHAFAQISAGLYHKTCAVTPAGDAYCWGLRVGLTPLKVEGGIVFRQIEVGSTHDCGLTEQGAAYCWGYNGFGQLGDGTTTDRFTPAPVASALTFRQLSLGAQHTCGLTASGRVLCWGWNLDGQVGMGWWNAPSYAVTLPQNIRYLVDVPYADLYSVQIAAGDRHTCAVSGSGAAYCWGANNTHQLGIATNGASRANPQRVPGGNAFTQIDAGSLHTCALTAAGAAWCWGSLEYLGTQGTSWGPVQVAGGLAFMQVRAGGSHSCALARGGIAYCWGHNSGGELGDGTTTHRYPPVVVAPFNFDRIAVGGNHSCALTVADAAYCWGSNYGGQVGDGTTAQRVSPAGAVGGIAFWQISEGLDHSCGVTVYGVAYCWGNNLYGKIGDGTITDRSTPTPVAGGLIFSRVRAGAQHTCGIANTGAVYCWGNNAHGQLGDGTTTNHLTPAAATGGYLFAELTVGSDHSCALNNAGEAYCWGSDGVIEYHTPALVPGALVFTQLSAGERFTCGLSSGAAYCWGINPDGQLGDGTTLNHPVPVPVSGGLSFTQLSTGASHACALTGAGDAYCWGANYGGQVGDGTTVQRTTPTVVWEPWPGALTWKRISGGRSHTCALTTSGAPYCWGRNNYSQLGDGTTSDHVTPKPVAGKLLFKE